MQEEEREAKSERESRNEGGVVIARSYQMAGAREVVALLRYRGIEARTGSGGLATYIWVGEDVTSPLHFVEVPASQREDALEILYEAEELDIVLVDESNDTATPDELDEPENAVIPESSALITRSLRAAMLSWIFPPIAPLSYWYLFKAAGRGIRQRDSNRAATAGALAALPTLLVLATIALIVIGLLRDQTMQRFETIERDDIPSIDLDKHR